MKGDCRVQGADCRLQIEPSTTDFRLSTLDPMRAAVITRPGGPEVVEIQERPTPEPGSGEVLVRVRAFGINRADLLQRRGAYPPPPGAPADIPGLEYAGEVAALGPGATRRRAGDRVMGLVGGGAYAEYVGTPEGEVMPVPDPLTFEDAAAVPEAFVTAWDALERLNLAAGDWLLIHAVASGVGTAAVQLARLAGVRTIGTSRTAAKLERMRELGLEVGVDVATDDFVEIVQRETREDGRGKGEGWGVEGALELVGGEYLPRTLEALAPRGKVVLVGLTAGRAAELDLGRILSRRLTIEGTVLRTRSSDEKAGLAVAFTKEVLPHFAAGRLRPVVDRVLPFEEVREAHRLLEANATFGKVVVVTGAT